MRQTSCGIRQRSIVLGLDGGGTKTVCVAYDAGARIDDTTAVESLEPLARVVVGSTNWNSVGADKVKANLNEAFTTAVRDAGAVSEDIAFVCLGMSGVDRPEDKARINVWLEELLPGVPAIAQNDAVIALASGTRGRLFGIVLISGTGMIAMGFDEAGKRCRAGGWGALLGDGGSGYAIGAAALRAVTWAADGRGPDTLLTELILDRLHLEGEEQLVRWAYDDISWHRFAELAPLVSQAAERQDAVADEIIWQAMNDLAVAVQSVARRLDLQSSNFPLVFVGGGLGRGLLQQRLRAWFHKTLPNADIILPSVEPAVGAALLALRSLER